MNIARQYSNAFLDLMYPRICEGCGFVLQHGEKIICSSCLTSIPFTSYEKSNDNAVAKLFWGRLKLEYATAMFFYDKGSYYQHMMHRFKYHRRKEVGILLGKTFGSILKNNEFAEVDVLLPVPLHPVKQRQRGYNQSEIIAEAIAEILDKDVITDLVIRKSNTKSQTTRSRYQRWENISGIFQCLNPGPLINKHVLLIDDVVTTGATIEALGQELKDIPGIKLSLATLAVSQV